MRHAFEMPFGARWGESATRFRLWAPDRDAVALVLGPSGARRIPMVRESEGWHVALVEGVATGEAYAFHLGDDLPPVPDPASRFNPWDAKNPSAVVDPRAYEWTDDAWRGRPWREAVVYELHVGAFTPEGTYAAATGRLDHLADLGITCVELMPLADFPGARNWGYDGVLPFAPDSAYGAPEDLKRFIDAAHGKGLMVLLDVVYNHFGPEGNWLPTYAGAFFNPAHRTPWGAAINFDGEAARTVRDFYVANALYWIEEYRFDGLRMDAVHAIADDSPRHIVAEIAESIAAGPGRERAIHLVLENDDNRASLLARARPHATAQWNDDSHHAFHVALSGEGDGYYRDYADRPLWHLGRTLTAGYSYQGEGSPHRGGARRGEPSRDLPPEAFVNFLQNHDQVGNRALGERLVALAPPEAVALAAAILVLSPPIPMLFMGDELGTSAPFLYFCDFEGDLARAVREGRRREFAAFERFRDPAARVAIPDPNDPATFLASKLPWEDLALEESRGWMALWKHLIAVRAREIVPRLADASIPANFRIVGETGLEADWTFADGARLHLRANAGPRPVHALRSALGRTLHEAGRRLDPIGGFAPWSGAWTIEDRAR